MTYGIVVVLRGADGVVALTRDKDVVAISDAVPVRAMATALLPTMEELCAQHDIACRDITALDVQSDLSESAITQRAVRTVRTIFAYARDAWSAAPAAEAVRES